MKFVYIRKLVIFFDIPICLDLLGLSAAGARVIPPILRDLVLISALEE
jgi:hypothetical protein